MKTLIVMALALVSSAAFARPNTANLTCADAAGLVASKGAVVMSHGNPNLYQRFVASSFYCGSGEVAATAYVKAIDTDSCRVGNICVDRDSGGSSVKLPSDFTVCKEGKFGFARKSDYYPGSRNDDREETITVVCQAGKWVPANDRGWKSPRTKGGGVCKEGAIDIYPTPEHEGQPEIGSVVRKCVGGKWVRQN